MNLKEMQDLVIANKTVLVSSALGGAAIIGLARILGHLSFQKARSKWATVGRDVVVLHQFPRSVVCVNLSPFPVKLETFLRMNKIRYVVEDDYPMSSKGKSPWITINGVDVADSQLAIEHLANHFEIDMNSHLSKEERSVARSMRSLLEDHLYFCVAVEKWKYEGGLKNLEQLDLPKNPISKLLIRLVFKWMQRVIVDQGNKQGIGRHSREDINRMAIEDMTAVEDYLGGKRYLMGDKATEVDCTLFGFLAVFMYAPMAESQVEWKERFPMLKQYADRVKDEFYPDWTLLISRKDDPTKLEKNLSK